MNTPEIELTGYEKRTGHRRSKNHELFVCSVCGQAEVELAEKCPGPAAKNTAKEVAEAVDAWAELTDYERRTGHRRSKDYTLFVCSICGQSACGLEGKGALTEKCPGPVKPTAKDESVVSCSSCPGCETPLLPGYPAATLCPPCSAAESGPRYKLATPADMAKVYGPTTKASNPKDAVGCDKVPLHLWPTSATIGGALALLHGMLQYGRSNWRAVGVKASIYHDALQRHAAAWWEGEDLDPDSGLPHLYHVLACAAILVDAGACGNLTDDRAYPGGYRSFIDSMTSHVKRLKELHEGKTPKHYTIGDKGPPLL